MNYNDELRRNPKREEDYMNLPPQKEPMFPREILQPIYEEWKRSRATSNHSEEFFNYLLRIPKPFSSTIEEKDKEISELKYKLAKIKELKDNATSPQELFPLCQYISNNL